MISTHNHTLRPEENAPLVLSHIERHKSHFLKKYLQKKYNNKKSFAVLDFLSSAHFFFWIFNTRCGATLQNPPYDLSSRLPSGKTRVFRNHGIIRNHNK